MNKKTRSPLFHITKRDALPWYKSWGIRAAAILLALIVCSIITTTMTGENPLQVYATIFNGSFGSPRKVWVLLQNIAMLLCIALAVTPAFKMRFWNIGGEGQVLAGALAAAACMICLRNTLPNALVIVCMCVSSILAGALWGFIPAYFKAKYNTNETKRTIEFFDGPVAYGEKMITLFGMRSDKALTLFNQIVGVKVLDDLDSFIRTNMLEEVPAEEKYQELKDNFQNLMEAKTNIDKVKEQIAQLEPINTLAKELMAIDTRIAELEQEKSVVAYWFAARTVDLCNEELARCKSNLRKLEDELKALKVKKSELEQEQTCLSVAIEKDEVGQQIREIEKEINQKVKMRDNRKAKAEEYDKLAKLVKMEQSPDVEVFEINRATAKREKDALQVTIDRQLMEEKRQAQNRQDEISSNIEERMATIRYLQQHKNNISGRVAEIRDEILEAVGATTEEIPFIGELICVKDDERDWEYSIERILHNFALRLVVPEKYYKQVNEYVNGHNLRGRIVYQRYQGAETIREFEDRTLKVDSLLRKVEYKSKCLYLD